MPHHDQNIWDLLMKGTCKDFSLTASVTWIQNPPPDMNNFHTLLDWSTTHFWGGKKTGKQKTLANVHCTAFGFTIFSRSVKTLLIVSMQHREREMGGSGQGDIMECRWSGGGQIAGHLRYYEHGAGQAWTDCRTSS